MSRVDIGFLEKAETWLLKSDFFPSKIGGKPAWLDLKELPTTEDLQCKLCKQQMIFLCQIYAPVETLDTCFHRTIFVFICRNATCCIPNDNNNLVVWRSQLPRQNSYYSFDPPVEEESSLSDIANYVNICELCGASASKHCSKCKITSYCSREHQIKDWKLGHKAICSSGNKSSENKSSVLFEEWELAIEEEIIDEKNREETLEQAEERRMKEYELLVDQGKTGTLTEVSETDLQIHAAFDEDKVFAHFRKQIAANPNQVLRYERGGVPLWIASDPCPTEIPACELCNSDRQFEFQILPQLLYQLHENILDWGTLAIYTCKNNCNNGTCYKREFIFKQDISSNPSN